MKKFRLISILLALMLLASCGGEGTATGDTTPSDTTANSESGGVPTN